ncbi:hypothetical protein K438DRAFT_1769795 [Mycena galopus ATCC 62051]|nr:hypothetical protein K438DRAFT_1769795 [Mycena galopus ATCC 62051]
MNGAEVDRTNLELPPVLLLNGSRTGFIWSTILNWDQVHCEFVLIVWLRILYHFDPFWQRRRNNYSAPDIVAGNYFFRPTLCSHEECFGYDDESDVPVEGVINHVISHGAGQLPRGFAVTDTGALVCNGTAEDPKLEVDVGDPPLSIRRGKHSGKKNTLYQGDMWEGY